MKSKKDLILKETIANLLILFPNKMTLNAAETAQALGLNNASSIYNRLKKSSASTLPIQPKRIGRQLRWSIIQVANYLCSED